MKYFTPEDSKKLGELGLKRPYEFLGIETKEDTIGYFQFSTLDICELENARKLWGEDETFWTGQASSGMIPNWAGQLMAYITLTDNERLKYVSDYLKTL